MAVRRAYIFAAILLSRGLPAAGVLLKQPFPKIFEAVEEDYSKEANESVPHDSRFTPGGPAPDGGWESVDPSARPSWWRLEGRTSKMFRIPRAMTYALGFHGEYQRDGERRRDKNTDFFINYDNIKSTIIRPLESQGGKVVIYFDTVNRTDCPERNGRLVKLLKPANHSFTGRWRPRIVDSYIAVLKMIQADLAAIDYIILLRFDVKYTMPITAMNINWQITNLPFREDDATWEACKKASDLFFLFPKRYVQGMIDALDCSGNQKKRATDCHGRPNSNWAGTGHFVYEPFVKAWGEGSMHFVEEAYNGSSNILYDDEAQVFLGISRELGNDYHSC